MTEFVRKYHLGPNYAMSVYPTHLIYYRKITFSGENPVFEQFFCSSKHIVHALQLYVTFLMDWHAEKWTNVNTAVVSGL